MTLDPQHPDPLVSASASVGRRDLLIGGALLGSAVLAAGLSQRLGMLASKPAGPLDRMVPNAIGAWSRTSAHDILIPKGEEPQDQPYDDVVTRYYTGPAQPAVMLLIAYGSAQNGTAQLHRPEVCYPAAGFRMSDWPDVSLEMGAGRAVPARAMTATAPGRIEQIIYWSRVGTRFPTDTLDQRLAILRATLDGAVPDGALVRMSTIHSDRTVAMRSLANFGRALVSASGSDLRRLLVGDR